MIGRVALALALIATPYRASAQTGDSGLVIEVKEGQLVSVNGQSASLAQLVADLCARTGATLRGYEAGDRPITVSYQDVPLRDVFQRMLRDETYMIGVRAGPTATAQPPDVEVSWIHVTGSKSGAPPSGVVAVLPPLATAPAPPPMPSKVPDSMATIGVAPNLITQALGSENAEERREATKQIADYLNENPGELDTFLSNNMGPAADQLAEYPFATDALRTLATSQKDMVARAKLDAFAKAVDLRRRGLVNKPSVPEEMQVGMPH